MTDLLPPPTAAWDGWDAVRLVVVVLATTAMARMTARWRTWLALPVDERFLRLALGALTASVGLRTWDLVGTGAPGGLSLLALVLALAYLQVALHVSRPLGPRPPPA